jgi:hypothetical protein
MSNFGDNVPASVHQHIFAGGKIMNLNWIGRLLIVAVLGLGMGAAHAASSSTSNETAKAAGASGPFYVPNRSGDVSAAPLKWAGLWETTDNPDEGFLSCTGQFITDDIVLMAAHCVRDRATGKYYDVTGGDTDLQNSFFLLQWENNKFSDVYRPLCVMTYDNWVVKFKPGETEDNPRGWSKETYAAYAASWTFDYAMVKVDHKSLTGHYNYALGGPAHWAVDTGYPAAPLGSAAVIGVDPGDVFPTSVLASMADFKNIQALWHGDTTFTEGSSGGAWVANYDTQNVGPKTNIVVGLNSFGQPGSKTGASFGPIFDKNFDQMIGIVSKCGQ